MEPSSDFYVILPSNVTAEQFPNNKTSSFKTPLRTSIHFNESVDWRCGLAEISFTHSYYNVQEGMTDIQFIKNVLEVCDAFEGEFSIAPYPNDGTIPAIQNPHYFPQYDSRLDEKFAIIDIDNMYKEKNIKFTKNISVGYYHNTEKLIRELNRNLPREHHKGLDFFNKTMFFINEESNKIEIKIRKGETLILNKKLADLLELPQNVLTGPPLFTPKKHVGYFGKKMIDLNSKYHSIYVYSNIIKNVIVGDSLSPLLRIVPGRGKDGDYIQNVFNTIYYYNVALDRADHIEIELRNVEGELIPFEYGNVNVVLHFKIADK